MRPFALRLVNLAALMLLVVAACLGPVKAQEAPLPAPEPGAAQAQEAPGEEEDRVFGFGPEPTAFIDTASLIAEQRLALSQVEERADGIERRMRARDNDDAALAEMRNRLEVLIRELNASKAAFRPKLTTLNERLAEIGDATEGEPTALAEERRTLLQEKAGINALLGEAEDLTLRVGRLIGEIAQIRSELFKNTLSRRYDVTAALNPAVLDEFVHETKRLGETVSSWLGFVLRFKLQSVALATVFAVLAAAVLMVGGRRLFGGMIIADPARQDPSYLSRLSVAFWSTLLPAAALAAFLAVTYYLYDYFGVLRDDIAQMMLTLFNVIVIVFFVYRLSRALLSPRLPNWRLMPVRSEAARTLFWLFWITALVTGLDFFMSKVNEVLRTPLSLVIAKSLVATLIVGTLVILVGFVRPFNDAEGRPRGWHRLFRLVIFGLGGGTILAALLGYIGLARFMSQQIVVTGAIVATMYIGFLSASAISNIGSFTKTTLGRRLDGRFQFDEAREDQLGLLASVIINLLVVLVGVPLILLQWGFQWGDLSAWAYNVASGIRIGSITISLIGILAGIAIFLVGFFVTRIFQRWLDGKVMERGRVDPGLRHSIRAIVGYAGIAVAAMIGISAAGIDLSNLALVAGALSLGIGFGLQNIVNNFVSGLILLAERPFKVGDWIVAGAVTGTVSKINVRATEIETFQRQTVIMPNSELINSAVGNWTHRNSLGRVEIRVRAAYDSDPRKVHDLLLEIATRHPLVLRNPAPAVAFVDFAESSLDFEIRLFLADITAQGDLGNELRFQIMEEFAKEGIGIPFPQRDLNIRPAQGSLDPQPLAQDAQASQRNPAGKSGQGA